MQSPIEPTVLRSTNDLRGYTIHATDGDIGKIDQFLFDDETWTIRYLVVNTGNWLQERLVLISPLSLGQPNWERQTLDVNLTREQVKNSPDIATDQPVSRQQEIELFRHYNYPIYWGGTGLWGASMYPTYPGYATPVVPEEDPNRAGETEPGDPHLRGTKEVTGYHIRARDGEIGHVEDFVIDDTSWAIRYMVVDTRNWFPGKKVLVSPRWIEAVSWAERIVAVDLTRDAIKQSPEYDPSTLLNREYETRLYRHYGRSAYWED